MNCLALSGVHTFSSGNVQHRNATKQTHGAIKRFCLLKRTCTCLWWKLDSIEYKNQNIKIERARTQYLSKPHKAAIRPSPVVNNNPENQDVFIRNIAGNKSYAQVTIQLNSARASNNVAFWGIASLTLVLNWNTTSIGL